MDLSFHLLLLRKAVEKEKLTADAEEGLSGEEEDGNEITFAYFLKHV